MRTAKSLARRARSEEGYFPEAQPAGRLREHVDAEGLLREPLGATDGLAHLLHGLGDALDHLGEVGAGTQHAQATRIGHGCDEPDTQTAYAIRLYCYGTLGMTREWLLEDNITPAEVAVRMMFASMPQMLRRVYFGTDD